MHLLQYGGMGNCLQEINGLPPLYFVIERRWVWMRNVGEYTIIQFVKTNLRRAVIICQILRYD
jgi:hypothetical protein